MHSGNAHRTADSYAPVIPMTSPSFAIAVKSYIVRDNKLLVIKRRPNDPHRPSTWDIPGGRLAPGENPHDGIRREAGEETGLTIEVVCPLGVQHFTRDDGQRITMIIFYCRPQTANVMLSEEHTEFKWLDLQAGDEQVPDWLREETLLWRRLENVDSSVHLKDDKETIPFATRVNK